MTNTPLNPADESRLKKALEQSANGQVVSRGSFAQYAQTQLNPDAIHAVMVKLLPAYVGIGPNAGRFSEAVTRNAREHIENVVSAYLEVAQPVLTTQEELDSMPHETIIRDSKDCVFERIILTGKDPEWWSTTEFLNETEVILPARVLFIPEVKP